MMDEIEEREFSASSLEEAVDKACDYYNVTENHLEYQVTKSENRGLLRNKKLITILAKPGELNKKTPGIPVSIEAGEYEKMMFETVCDIIKLTGLNLKVELNSDDERFIINISGPDRMFIMNRNAETLEAMQFIMNKIGMKNPDYRKILLDSNGFRGQKEHQLIQLAHSSATKVKRNKRSVTLEPLNSYERRIIHMALANDSEVKTESKGDGQLKRITIFLS